MVAVMKGWSRWERGKESKWASLRVIDGMEVIEWGFHFRRMGER